MGRLRDVFCGCLALISTIGAAGCAPAGVADAAPETGGFVRTSLRSLALDRAQDGVGAGPPFSLHMTGNGRLILEDPATGQWISLDAFGKDNVAEFERLFEEGRAAR